MQTDISVKFCLNKVTNCYKRPNEIVETKYEKKANLKKNKKFYLKFKKIC